MSSGKKPYPPPVEQSFVSHLVELRDRLLRGVVVVIVLFLSLFYFANDLYTYLADPLMRHMPEGTSMIATEVASPFLTPFKLTMVVSIFLAMPFLLYQAWAFIAPGLYQSEKRLVYPLLVSSIILFYLGMAFAYYVVFPLVFGFLTSLNLEGVAMMTDIARYLDFVLKMFFAFGIAFEVPIATILVIWSGMTTAKSLAAKRPYIIVAAFVIGMLLTPPDVISQTLLAIPMWALFELGLVMSKLYTRPQEESEGSGQNDESAENSESGESGEDTTSDAGANQTDEDPGYGDQYQEDTEPMTEEEMDAELDRIEAQEELDELGEASGESHPEFEPVPDDASDQVTGLDTGRSGPNATGEPGEKPEK